MNTVQGHQNLVSIPRRTRYGAVAKKADRTVYYNVQYNYRTEPHTYNYTIAGASNNIAAIMSRS